MHSWWSVGFVVLEPVTNSPVSNRSPDRVILLATQDSVSAISTLLLATIGHPVSFVVFIVVSRFSFTASWDELVGHFRSVVNRLVNLDFDIPGSNDVLDLDSSRGLSTCLEVRGEMRSSKVLFYPGLDDFIGLTELELLVNETQPSSVLGS